MEKNQISNVQLEILKLYSTNLSQKDLEELKVLLAQFYAKRAIDQADKIWDEKKLTNQKMERWLCEK